MLINSNEKYGKIEKGKLVMYPTLKYSLIEYSGTFWITLLKITLNPPSR